MHDFDAIFAFIGTLIWLLLFFVVLDLFPFLWCQVFVELWRADIVFIWLFMKRTGVMRVPCLHSHELSPIASLYTRYIWKYMRTLQSVDPLFLPCWFPRRAGDHCTNAGGGSVCARKGIHFDPSERGALGERGHARLQGGQTPPIFVCRRAVGASIPPTV